MRTLGRVLCWLVIAAAAFLAVICAVLIIPGSDRGDDGDARLGAAVILIPTLAVLAAAWVGQRRLRRGEREERRHDVGGLQRQVRAGEPVTLHPSRRRRVVLFLFSLALIVGAALFAVAAPSVIVKVAAAAFGCLFVFTAIELAPGTGRLPTGRSRSVARIRTDDVPVVTAALAVACIALFVSEASRFGLFPTATELAGAGGASRDGAWWTLLYANVLHANPIHLVLNLIALLVLGYLLERELGWLRMPSSARSPAPRPWGSPCCSSRLGGLAAGLLLGAVMARAGAMDDAWLTKSRPSASA